MNRVIYIPEFIFYYLMQLSMANLSLIKQIFFPANGCKTTILNIPVYLKSNTALLLLTNMISMSPNTLTLDLTEDKKNMTVHTISGNSDEKIVAYINNIQKKIQKITC